MGKKRAGKQARHVPSFAAAVHRPDRQPRVGVDVSFWSAHPCWSFSHLDLVAPFGGWIHLQQSDLDELLARFKHWETMTWDQILVLGKKHNHTIKVSACSSPAQARLRFLRLDDISELISLRVNSRARVFGILDRGVLKLLWWDPRHEVCPSLGADN